MAENDGPDTGVSAPEEGVFSEPTVTQMAPSIMDELSSMAAVTMGAEPPNDYRAPEVERLQEEVHFPKEIERQAEPETAPVETAPVAPAEIPAVVTPTESASTATPNGETVPKEQYDALMALYVSNLNSATPQPQAQPQVQNQGAPAGITQQSPVPIPATPVAPAPQQTMRAYITPDNHDEFLTNPAFANQLILQVANDIYQQAMLNTVPIAQNASRFEVQQQNMIADYWKANQHHAGIDPSVIGTLANQLQAENPGWSHFEVYKNLGPYVDLKLKIAKQAAAVAPVVPKFVKPTANGATAAPNRSTRPSVQDELADMGQIAHQFV